MSDNNLSKNAKIALVGGALAAIGALLPWATLSGEYIEYTANGFDGGGTLTFIFGAAITLLVFTRDFRGRVVQATAALGGLTVLIAFSTLQNLNSYTDELGGFSAEASAGVGLYLTLLAGGILILSAYLEYSNDDPAPNQPAYPSTSNPDFVESADNRQNVPHQQPYQSGQQQPTHQYGGSP